MTARTFRCRDCGERFWSRHMALPPRSVGLTGGESAAVGEALRWAARDIRSQADRRREWARQHPGTNRARKAGHQIAAAYQLAGWLERRAVDYATDTEVAR